LSIISQNGESRQSGNERKKQRGLPINGRPFSLHKNRKKSASIDRYGTGLAVDADIGGMNLNLCRSIA
jgi:hypothetical protein